MAGDWIKMRNNLWDDPRVGRLAELTNTSEATAIGALYWLWAMADQHSEDGFLVASTLKTLDRKTGVPGFGAALASIGWVAEDEGGLRITRFDEHNGASAKRRMLDAQRKANGRKVSASDADTSGTETGQHEELEKEKIEITPPDGGVGTGKPTPQPHGKRLPADWVLPKALGEWALSEYPHWTADIVRRVARSFADHWHAKAGKEARKLDWNATWRNWCSSGITQRDFPPPQAERGRETEPTVPSQEADRTADYLSKRQLSPKEKERTKEAARAFRLKVVS